MNEYLKPAIEKLEKEYKAFKGDRYEEVMKADVHKAVKGFCQQNAEFAQAVAQGGDFKGCMAAVRRAVHGNAISDNEAFAAAASYYFRGARVKFWMEVLLEPGDNGTDAGRMISAPTGTENATQDGASEGAPPRDEVPKGEQKRGLLIDLTEFL